ncbi:hypothetical protein HDU83_005364 [Entophlyctis luteolus]|nr:hypothetical protein HDU83_005364 [Entophlyctis luteolus]
MPSRPRPRPGKRARPDPGPSPAATAPLPPAADARAFAPGLLDAESADALARAYAQSAPYLHVVIPNLLDDSLLRDVRKELLAIHATEKETDIYKVFQTGDLANLDGLPESELAQLKSLFTLRNALYSDEFRAFVSKVCGVGPLSPSKSDLSHTIYKQGCHLLCHDDVIGTRSVSYIIYLPDPDDKWTPDDGGGLELFPVVAPNTPSVHPSVVIPPAWNQMAMFAVQPGKSFHSVAEVVSKKNRPSISGWFHVMQPEDFSDPKEAEAVREKLQKERDADAKASMDQLLDDDVDFPFEPLNDATENGDDEVAPLTKDEIEYLKQFINPAYLNQKTIEQANERFCEESSIELTSFLTPKLASALENATRCLDEQDGFFASSPKPANYAAGTNYPAWTATGPSHKHRFMQLKSSPAQNPPATGASVAPPCNAADPTADLALLDQSLFRSAPFARFLHLITALRPVHVRSRVRRFRPGMDYTLATTTSAAATGGAASSGVLDATLCFVSDKSARHSRAWASDEVGGFDCYMAPDESNDDPAQYRAQKTGYGGSDDAGQGGDGGALLSVSARSNCLSLVMRENDVMRFIKYVSASAPGSRWDVAAEYQFQDD